MCSGTCTSEKKKLSIEKHKIFLFQVFDFFIFHKNVHPTTVSASESESELFVWIRIQPKHSDYFGFGSTTLLLSKKIKYKYENIKLKKRIPSGRCPTSKL
jgi:hypothetical protein